MPDRLPLGPGVYVRVESAALRSRIDGRLAAGAQAWKGGAWSGPLLVDLGPDIDARMLLAFEVPAATRHGHLSLRDAAAVSVAFEAGPVPGKRISR